MFVKNVDYRSTYFLSLIPYFVVPSAVTYLALRFLHQAKPTVVPAADSWIGILICLFARPTFFFVTWYYTKWIADPLEARNRGAVSPPHIKETAIGIIPDLIESTRVGYPGNMIYQWSKTYGNTYQFSLLTNRIVVTFEPEHVKAILATQFDEFEKGPTFIAQMASMLGSGVFNADGEIWRFHRTMTRPFFTRERISDFEIYDRNCTLSLNEASSRAKEGHSIDFQDLFGRFTLDSATQFLFGYNVDSLSAGLPYPPNLQVPIAPSFYNHPSNTFITAFTEGLILSVSRVGLGGDWPLGEIKGDRIAPLRNTIESYIEPLLQEALIKEEERKIKNEEKANDEEDLTLLDHLVKHTQDPKFLKDELINLLVAGRDTTMALLTFSLLMIIEHPGVEKRLRAEIFEKVGPSGKPTYGQMREMKYMRAFLNEVLRLYPPVPVDIRFSNSPVVLPAGGGQKPIYIPANTQCNYSIMYMQMRTDLWGPDALQFDPDRFLDERLHKYLTPNPFIFCPFNAGPRICLGQQFAYHEATYYIVRLLQRFTGFALDDAANLPPPPEWKDAPEERRAMEKVYLVSHMTMFIKGGMWVKMRELESADL